jgi:hypothetical protein
MSQTIAKTYLEKFTQFQIDKSSKRISLERDGIIHGVFTSEFCQCPTMLINANGNKNRQTFLKNNDITLKYISDGYLLGPMIMLQCILDDVKIKNRYYATYIHKNNFQWNEQVIRYNLVWGILRLISRDVGLYDKKDLYSVVGDARADMGKVCISTYLL